MHVTVDREFWRDRRVLVTGHNGFKGAWLCLWLQALGARVRGVSLAAPPTSPSLYELARVREGMERCIACDVRDTAALARTVQDAHPEIVIHLAAQPLVRASFAAPAETFAVNTLGSAHLLDAVRGCQEVRAVVIVTSDKCYAPIANGRPHVEGDPLGGDDPYSASKAGAELVTAAYRDSFFTAPDRPRVATARAGNVIGGGDFGAERLLPDLFRAALAGEPLLLRNPEAVRPWQHVLSPLSGYLLLAQALCESGQYARAWNFGPDELDALTVRELVARVAELWPTPVDWRVDEGEHPRENPTLRLDSTRARAELGWCPSIGLEQALRMTAEWFCAYRAGADMREATIEQIDATPVQTASVGR
ncbi:MAG TPA: CDP-glucose 4,6-dehydratase [Solirubrobacteraceae bacterium]|nr:CDP-glucose 4,6-dehydratase [Solirubrobacteraceae bacterium]